MTAATLDQECWFAKRLREHGAGWILAGDTTAAVRRERVRAAILKHRLEPVIIGRGRDGKPMTYEQAFERLYGQSLHVEQPEGTNACI